MHGTGRAEGTSQEGSVTLTPGVVAALITAGFLGLWFPTTRGIAVAALAALTFFYPWLVVPMLIA